MKYIWSVLCQRVTTNIEDGLVNLLGCISAIFYSPKKTLLDGEIVPGLMSLATLWEVEEVEEDFLRYKIDLIGPNNKKINTIIETKIEIQKDKSNLTTCNPIKGIPYTGDGIYVFRIYKMVKGNYKKIDAIPLKLKTKGKLYAIKKNYPINTLNK